MRQIGDVGRGGFTWDMLKCTDFNADKRDEIHRFGDNTDSLNVRYYTLRTSWSRVDDQTQSTRSESLRTQVLVHCDTGPVGASPCRFVVQRYQR